MNTFSSKQIAKTGDLTAELITRQNKLDEMAKLMEIKSINPKLKQSKIARELQTWTCTLQRFKRKIKMD